MKLLGRVALQCRSVSKPQKRIFSQILNILVLNVYMQLMIIKQLRKTFHMKNMSKKKQTERKQLIRNKLQTDEISKDDY